MIPVLYYVVILVLYYVVIPVLYYDTSTILCCDTSTIRCCDTSTMSVLYIMITCITVMKLAIVVVSKEDGRSIAEKK